MNKCPSKELIEETANELGVNPSFIEKDWFATELLKSLASREFRGCQLVFAGGTSLSKGYGLIQRFSEDLDFKILNAGNLNREQRRRIRQDFTSHLKNISEFKIDDKNILVRNEGKNFCIEVEYSNCIDFPSFLRPFLQVELFFDDDNLPSELRTIQSFTAQYSGQSDKALINCIKPFNTGADKFNALCWRIFNNERLTDYTLLRHLHDLYAIRLYLEDKTAFKERVLYNFNSKDKHRLQNPNIEFSQIVYTAIKKLENNPTLKKGYEDYVASMSYATDSEKIAYIKALDYFKTLGKLF